MENYVGILGPNAEDTSYAGTIWTDKSVFTDAGAFAGYSEEGTNSVITMEEADDNFLVALSAMSSNKQISGYTNLPTDTILVVDASSSMSHDSLYDMTDAVNAAITKLNSVNEHNRVGVVIFERDAATFLPLARYTPASYEDGVGIFIEGEKLGNSGDRFRFDVADGVLKDGQSFTNRFTAQNGTYTQYGLLTAMEMFLEADPKIDSGEIQGGTTRIPIMVLMTDGEPARSHSDFDNINKMEEGYQYEGINATNAFLTQLTMAYTKPQIEDHYGVDALYYTLGYDLTGENTYAQDTLDPVNASTTNKGYQQTYLNATGNTVTIRIEGTRVSVERIADITNFDYTDKYFVAEKGTLTDAFDDIVEEIILQSAYYVTLSEIGNPDMTGYVTITDYIGEDMDICDVKGMVHEGQYYTGAAFAQYFAQNGVDSEYGDELVRVMRERMGLEFDSTAEALLNEAIADGQIGVNNGEYNNYITWYADSNREYTGFIEKDTTVDQLDKNQVYAVRSYGFLADISAGAEEANLGYVNVDVFYNIATGQQGIRWMVPASLIPTTTHQIKISTDDLDNPGDISVQVDATEALRLVFEVRLNPNIDALTITSGEYDDHKNADGTYSFYTNAYDTNNLTVPSLNTSATFQPSEGNERYYYTEDTAIYVKNGDNYVRYSGNADELPEGTYYAAHHIFSWDKPAGEDGSYSVAKAQMTIEYEPINAAALEKAFYDEETKNWFIPKGTQRMYEADTEVDKTSNPTDTQDFSLHPLVAEAQGEHMEVDVLLGNNGLLIVEPTQGIMIEKQLAEGAEPTDETFNFTITLSPLNKLADSYPARHVDRNGSITDTMVSHENGVVNVGLKTGEKFYLLELPTGVAFEVTEEDRPDYVLQSVNSSTLDGFKGVVREYIIETGVYINRPAEYGDLSVTKRVDYDTVSDAQAAVLADKEFTVQVSLGSEYANAQIESSIGDLTADGNGNVTFTLKDGETVILNHIKEKTAYVVTETEMGAGFTFVENESTGLTGVIHKDGAQALVVNTYEPSAIGGGSIDLTGEKNFTGRDWKDGDSFTFTLEKYVDSDYVQLDTATVTYDADDDAFDRFNFSSIFAAETYDEIGTYSYRVTEVESDLGGVTYDKSVALIDVVVTDDDMDGALEISDVTVNGANATVKHENNTWNVHVIFRNTYAAQGSAGIDIDVAKTMTDTANAGHSAQGYTFVLSDANGTLLETAVTDAAGKVSFGTLVFDASDAGKTFTYTVREAIGSVGGVQYDDTVYSLTVKVIDNLDGTVSAVVYKSEEGKGDADEIELSFANTYDPEDTSIVLEAEKDLEGRELAKGEFTFNLYETGADFVVAEDAQPIDTAVNDEGGKAIFEEIAYSTVGTRYYVIVEDDSQMLDRVTYDNAAYHVTVNVTDEDGKLTRTVTVEKDGQRVEEITFRNVYTPKPQDISVSFDVQKVIRNLSVSTIAPEGFTFVLTDEQGKQQTAVTNAEGKASFTLSYSEDDIDKTYTYTVTELDEGKDYLEYDQTEYRVTVSIKLLANNTLKATVKVDGETVDGVDLTFTNLYNKPSAGLRIIKLYDDPDDTTDTTFTFDIALEGELSASYPVRIANADGTFTDSNMAPVDGKLEVELKAGQSFQMMELQPGVRYTVTERMHPSYVLKSVNGDTLQTKFSGTIEELELAEGVFVNRKLATGSLRITKVVEHPFADGKVPEELANKEFTVRVALGADYANVVVDSTAGSLQADAQGNVTFKIRDGRTVVLRGIAERTLYTVSETSMPNGFTFDANASSGLAGQIMADSAAAVLVNDYDFDPVSGAGITLQGDKTFEGRDWLETDSFTFNLDKLVDGEYVTIASRTVTMNTAGGAFDFSDVFDGETYSEIGNYYYRVLEDRTNPIAGVFYDDNRVEIKVEVTDSDVDGVLEISSVTIINGTNATVTRDGSDWNVHAKFYNKYSAEVIERITVNVDKTVIDTANMGHDPAGYIFQLKDAAGNVIAESLTDAAGHAELYLDYDEEDVGKKFTYTYTLSEQDGGEPGMQYDDTVYSMTVEVVDNLDGTASVIIYKTGAENKGDSTEFDAAFTNRYDPDDTSVVLEAEKRLEGRDLAEGEFSFNLYETDAGFIVEGNPIDTKANDADGHVTFDAITYSTVGTHYYVIEEDASDPVERVEYDGAKYFVTVKVTDDGEGKLSRTVTIEKGGEAVEEITFHNIYTPRPDDIEVTLNVEKLVDNIGAGEITAEDFCFVLGDLGTGSIVTVESDEEGKASFTLSYSEDDIGKTYEYVVCEIDDARPYVTYDKTEYIVGVTITLQEDNTLLATVTIDGESTDEMKLTFTNTYDKPAPPKTGDLFPKHWVYMGLTLMICLAAVVILPRKRKED